jgi:hypothetical protein
VRVIPLGGRRHFLKGPIPWWWLERAIGLPGRALPVALVVWLWSGMRRTATIRLSMCHIFPSLAISRFAVYRALEELQRAGLVRVRRRQGHAPLVTILSRTARTTASFRLRCRPDVTIRNECRHGMPRSQGR